MFGSLKPTGGCAWKSYNNFHILLATIACWQCMCVIGFAVLAQNLRSLAVDSSDMTGVDGKNKRGHCFYLLRTGDGKYTFRVSIVH